MWLKAIIVILFIGLVISLFSGLAFLFNDKDKEPQARSRLWNALSVRLLLTGLLIASLIYGFYTGQLGSNAPWDKF